MSQIVEEEVTEINIESACRLCLLNEEGSEMTQADKEGLDSMGINVYIIPDFPTRICNQCNSILEFIQQFRKMCENSNFYLRNFCLKEEVFSESNQMELKDESRQELIIPEEVVAMESFQNHDELHNIQEETVAESEVVENIIDNVENVGAEIEAEIRNKNDNDSEFNGDEMWIEKCEDDASDDTVYVDECLLSNTDQKSDKTVNVQKTKKKKLLSVKHYVVIGKVEKEKKSSTERHVCDICGNHFKRPGALETHRRRHFNQRPFDCELCGETFTFNFLLEKHMRKHTGDRPFTCEFCDRKFVDRSTMSRHQKIHRNERAYKCDICEKSFTYYSVLKTHIMSHTGEKPYRCGICDKGFHRASDLKNHLETLQHRKDPRTPILLQEITKRKT